MQVPRPSMTASWSTAAACWPSPRSATRCAAPSVMPTKLSSASVSTACSFAMTSAIARSSAERLSPALFEEKRLPAAAAPFDAGAFDAAQLIALRRVHQIALAPDGQWLAVAVQRLDGEGAKYVTDLWRLPVDGGAAVQLTRGDHSDSAPCFRADGALGFLSNRPPASGKADDD